MTRRGSLLDKKCKVCGKKFYILKCKVKDNIGIYCSRDCQYIGKVDALKKHYADLKRGEARL